MDWKAIAAFLTAQLRARGITTETDNDTLVMFNCDCVCCKCRDRNRTVQIHHIDGNHKNDSIDNLTVLCFECHNETLLKGGFGRHLNPHLVRKYHEDWVRRVEEQRSSMRISDSANALGTSLSQS